MLAGIPPTAGRKRSSGNTKLTRTHRRVPGILKADAIGPDLSRATAVVTRSEREPRRGTTPAAE